MKIITSGHKGPNEKSYAQISAEKLTDLGVNANDILLLETPKDTQDEAIAVKEIVQNSPFIMVTTASHMPRAMMLFKAENLNPIPMATAFSSSKNSLWNEAFNANEIVKFQKAMHEYIGMLWHHLKQMIA